MLRPLIGEAGMHSFFKALIVSSVAALGGCAQPSAPASQLAPATTASTSDGLPRGIVRTTDPIPKNYKVLVAGLYRRLLKDPYSVRDAEISAPMNIADENRPGWTICVRANTKNGFGGYTGVKNVGLTIKDNDVVASFVAEEWRVCQDATGYVPFPELTAKGTT
jgi:hypothetical protein